VFIEFIKLFYQILSQEKREKWGKSLRRVLLFSFLNPHISHSKPSGPEPAREKRGRRGEREGE